MSENSKIEWTDHTFNGWWGCTKVHAGCKNCYAEALDKRYAQGVPSHWGNNPRRMILGEWSKPAKWNKEAENAGKRARVFCSSMCDVFEVYDGPVVDQQGNDTKWSIVELRRRIFTIIEETPHLDWLLLTKRPENVRSMVPVRWLENWPANVMTGTSPCDQTTAEVCIPHLLRIPGRHFLSCEPLLGPINLGLAMCTCPWPSDAMQTRHLMDCSADTRRPEDQRRWAQLHWVIVGGESGPHSRPFRPHWARSIVNQCQRACVPVFVKQMGSHVEIANDSGDEWPDDGRIFDTVPASYRPTHQGEFVRVKLNDNKGGDMAEWPVDLRVRQLPGGATC